MSISDGDRDGAFKALALRTIGNLGEDFQVDTEDSAPETRSMQLRKMSVRGRGRLV